MEGKKEALRVSLVAFAWMSRLQMMFEPALCSIESQDPDSSVPPAPLTLLLPHLPAPTLRSRNVASSRGQAKQAMQTCYRSDFSPTPEHPDWSARRPHLVLLVVSLLVGIPLSSLPSYPPVRTLDVGPGKLLETMPPAPLVLSAVPSHTGPRRNSGPMQRCASGRVASTPQWRPCFRWGRMTPSEGQGQQQLPPLQQAEGTCRQSITRGRRCVRSVSVFQYRGYGGSCHGGRVLKARSGRVSSVRRW